MLLGGTLFGVLIIRGSYYLGIYIQGPGSPHVRKPANSRALVVFGFGGSGVEGFEGSSFAGSDFKL